MPTRRLIHNQQANIYKDWSTIMEILKTVHGSYGECWVEREGAYFYVVILDGKSKKGPYSSVADAMQELSHYGY